MKRFLSTPGRDGYFDFFSNVIELSRFNIEHLDEIRDAIAWVPGKAPPVRGMEIRALLKHEITHFLDMTTTEWGCQYIFRKLRMIKYLDEMNEKAIQAQNVFMLETTEVEVHQELLSLGSVAPLDCEKIEHELCYTEKFGTILMIYYVRNQQRCQAVPLSMLSLLEANATASEFLSNIEFIESAEQGFGYKLSMEELERRLNFQLNDSERLEYSVLIYLVRIHFSELGLRELFCLVSALARFSLDATDMGMAAMANRIEASMLNPVLGKSISMELRRGAHRPLIYFKTVLFLYAWLQEMDQDTRGYYLERIRLCPHDVISELWSVRLGIENYVLGSGRRFMRSVKIEWLKELNSLADAEVFEQSSAANSEQLDKKSAGLIGFESLKLMNVLLSDGTEVYLPNRIDICVADYFEKNLSTLSKLDEVYKKLRLARFHIPPGTPEIFL